MNAYGLASERYHALRDDFAPSRHAVLTTAMSDFGIRDIQEADRACEAFLQWFLVVPVSGRNHRVVMLKGPVDRAWHALILHTRVYRNLCHQYLGDFLDHAPLEGSPPDLWVRQTVEILVNSYGQQLSPLLMAWSPTTIARMKTEMSLTSSKE